MYLLLEKIGSGTLGFLETSGRMGMFLMRTLTSIVQLQFKVQPVVRQVHFIGARSAFVILFRSPVAIVNHLFYRRRPPLRTIWGRRPRITRDWDVAGLFTALDLPKLQQYKKTARGALSRAKSGIAAKGYSLNGVLS